MLVNNINNQLDATITVY